MTPPGHASRAPAQLAKPHVTLPGSQRSRHAAPGPQSCCPQLSAPRQSVSQLAPLLQLVAQRMAPRQSVAHDALASQSTLHAVLAALLAQSSEQTALGLQPSEHDVEPAQSAWQSDPGAHVDVQEAVLAQSKTHPLALGGHSGWQLALAPQVPVGARPVHHAPASPAPPSGVATCASSDCTPVSPCVTSLATIPESEGGSGAFVRSSVTTTCASRADGLLASSNVTSGVAASTTAEGAGGEALPAAVSILLSVDEPTGAGPSGVSPVPLSTRLQLAPSDRSDNTSPTRALLRASEGTTVEARPRAHERRDKASVNGLTGWARP